MRLVNLGDENWRWTKDWSFKMLSRWKTLSRIILSSIILLGTNRYNVSTGEIIFVQWLNSSCCSRGIVYISTLVSGGQTVSRIDTTLQSDHESINIATCCHHTEKYVTEETPEICCAYFDVVWSIKDGICSSEHWLLQERSKLEGKFIGEEKENHPPA
jgi:hypothetical protein